MPNSSSFQNLRSKVPDKHPTNLEEGQVAFNMADPRDIYMYVGNGTDERIDDLSGDDMTPYLLSQPIQGKGWVRFRLSSRG